MFFLSQSAFRQWLQENHVAVKVLWVGFRRTASGKPSITYPQALDEALGFGWIDGRRKSIDENSYRVRFTPRKPDSIWSVVNTRRVRELIKLGRVHDSGLKVFESRDQEQSRKYSYKRQSATLTGDLEKRFRTNKKAWEFFQAQAPWYRRTARWWVISAKREETRQKRLFILIDDSARGRRLNLLNPKG